MPVTSIDVKSVEKTKLDLEKKINTLQEIGLPGIKDTVKSVWKLIEKNLLTPRQISKKLIMAQDPTATEEDAQLVVYGKLYYKNGELYDNDVKDPACVAKPGDEDYLGAINEDHPLFKNILGMIKNLKDGLIQLGIKLGEFTLAIPSTIATIVVSLIALVSSIVILPFGSGIPTAITTVKTMVGTVKELQSKTAALLPLLGVVDLIALLLPKEAQFIVAQLNAIFAIILAIITGLTAILGLLDKITSALSKSEKKMEEQKLSVECSANPETINVGETVKLNVTASGGDWNFTYKWLDPYNNVISDSQSISLPLPSTATFTCIVTDGTGSTKSDRVKVKVN